jgi:XRE family transcriptional regulator, aerobic/anaerobic benzoate catabolism transcriptional regulator
LHSSFASRNIFQKILSAVYAHSLLFISALKRLPLMPATTAHKPRRTGPHAAARQAKPVVAAEAETSVLAALAERTRTLRAQRGMTRKILARDSGVSERYLAHLEAGQGNLSVLLLSRIAQALNVSLDALLRTANELDAEREELSRLARRLNPAQTRRLLDAARRELGEEGASGEGDERHSRIALIGLRGAGKSSLGAALAKKLKAAFVELDREIEVEAKLSLNEVFLLYGQAGYRRLERAALERVLAKHASVVIATGGSIVSEPETYDYLLNHCQTVWLKAQPEEHMARVVAQGDTRPMKGNREAMDDLRRILSTRASLYGRADHIVDTSHRSVEESLNALATAVTHS